MRLVLSLSDQMLFRRISGYLSALHKRWRICFGEKYPIVWLVLQRRGTVRLPKPLWTPHTSRWDIKGERRIYLAVFAVTKRSACIFRRDINCVLDLAAIAASLVNWHGDYTKGVVIVISD